MAEPPPSELEECVQALKRYLDRGVEEAEESPEEEASFERIELEKFKPVEASKPAGLMLSVDASSYPLLSANNWRIGVSRCAYVIVEVKGDRPLIVEENYEDHLFTVVCERKKMPYKVWEILRTFESNLALKKLENFGEEDFCLLDGAAYFGGSRSFTQPLYEQAKRLGVKMVMIPKSSRRLRDERGRDLLASLSLRGEALRRQGFLGATWIYHPITKLAQIKSLNLYAEVSAVKLSPSSRRVFRCDVIDYLVEEKGVEAVFEVASKLAYLSRDVRCDGYPAPLYLAHQRTKIPEAKLIEYEEAVRRLLREEGLLEALEAEAEIASFRKALLGLIHDYQVREVIEDL